jgi:LAO/AO transport system kinase
MAAETFGTVRSIARALSVVERGGAEAESLLASVLGATGRARTVGLTGPPGVGKSTLLQAVGLGLVRRGGRVGVLAVDPSSPFSGGALLGDRVRMPELLAAGGFVRSMATRGALGGLAAATADAIDILDAAGFDWILVETIGVGQDEVDVASTVDTVVVVTVAALGDDVQAAKAGVMEIGDVFVVNKADLPGAESQIANLEWMLSLAPPSRWRPCVLPAIASSGEGADEVVTAILDHEEFLDATGERGERRRSRARLRVERLALGLLQARLRGQGAAVDEVLAAIGEGRLDPYSASRVLAARVCGEEAE